MDTIAITKAAKKLATAEKKLSTLVADKEAAVAKVTAKASAKYTEKITAKQNDVASAKAALQELAAAA
jgi:hypothetical protein